MNIGILIANIAILAGIYRTPGETWQKLLMAGIFLLTEELFLIYFGYYDK